MNVPRRLMGKMVEVQWMDPGYARVAIDEFKPGRGALATWLERGTIYDMTDDVVIVLHSECRQAGSPDNAAPRDLAYTSIPMALIEKVTVYEPQRDIQREGA